MNLKNSFYVFSGVGSQWSQSTVFFSQETHFKTDLDLFSEVQFVSIKYVKQIKSEFSTFENSAYLEIYF